MDSKDIFFAEQVYLDKVIGMLLKEGESLKAGKEPNLIFWRFYERFMIDFVEKHHLRKEEHILKTLLKKNLKEDHRKCIEGMICEHEMGRHLITRLGEIVNKDFGNNNKTIEGLKKIMEVTEQKFKDHSKTEAKNLYGYIEEHFEDKDHKEFRDMFLKSNEQMDYVGYAKSIFNMEKNYSAN